MSTSLSPSVHLSGSAPMLQMSSHSHADRKRFPAVPFIGSILPVVVAIALFLVTATAGLAQSGESQTWTDSHGRTIRGKFVRLDGSAVVIDINGRVLKTPFTNLSAASVALAKKLGGGASYGEDSSAEGPSAKDLPTEKVKGAQVTVLPPAWEKRQFDLPTASPADAAALSAQALGLCEAAAKARAAGDVKAWERHVKDAFLIFDTKPLPKDTARRVLETALAYAEATPGEEGTAVALRFDLSTLDWSLEKRAAFRDLHYAEKQYLEINQGYEAAESMIRRQRRFNEQGGGRASAVPGIDPNLMMQRNAAFQLYKEAKQRFDALPGGLPPSQPGQK